MNNEIEQCQLLMKRKYDSLMGGEKERPYCTIL